MSFILKWLVILEDLGTHFIISHHPTHIKIRNNSINNKKYVKVEDGCVAEMVTLMPSTVAGLDNYSR